MRKAAFILLSLIIVLCLCSCSAPTDSGNLPPVEESTPVIDESNDGKITLMMAGDILLHERVVESGELSDGSYSYDHLFSNVKDEIEGSDIALVNQEVILGGKELGISGYPCFNGPFEVGDALVNAGFDVVLHATNHALDKGKAGVISCLNFWRERHPEIKVLGIKDDESTQNLTVIEKEGIKIAFLNYTYGTNGIPLPSDMPYCVEMLTRSRLSIIESEIAAAKKAADIVCVVPHWGTEYVYTPDKNQEYWTSIFFKNGVDIVIGAHPHVIEPVEVIKDENHEMLVYYSLGNFVNASNEWDMKNVGNRMLGALADIEITKDENGVYVSDYGVIPIVAHIETEKKQMLTVYRLDEYTEALASENEIIRQDRTFSLAKLQTLCRDVFGELYE